MSSAMEEAERGEWERAEDNAARVSDRKKRVEMFQRLREKALERGEEDRAARYAAMGSHEEKVLAREQALTRLLASKFPKRGEIFAFILDSLKEGSVADGDGARIEIALSQIPERFHDAFRYAALKQALSETSDIELFTNIALAIEAPSRRREILAAIVQEQERRLALSRKEGFESNKDGQSRGEPGEPKEGFEEREDRDAASFSARQRREAKHVLSSFAASVAAAFLGIPRGRPEGAERIAASAAAAKEALRKKKKGKFLDFVAGAFILMLLGVEKTFKGLARWSKRQAPSKHFAFLDPLIDRLLAVGAKRERA